MFEAIPPLALVAAAAALYGAGVRTIWRNRPRSVLPAWRVACFLLGLAAVAGALVGPLDKAADDRFSAHMTQHVLLTMLAAPLLAAGAPVSVVLLCLSRAARKRVAVPVLRSRVTRVLLSPVFAFVAFIGVLWGSHYPAIYDAAAGNQALHDLEHLCYLATAVLLWSVVLGLEPGPKRAEHAGRLLLLLFCLMATTGILGLVLSSTSRPLYPYYVRAARESGISPTNDQHLGGAIMWVCGMVIAVAAMVPVLLSWLAEDERRTAHAQLRAAENAPSLGG